MNRLFLMFCLFLFANLFACGGNDNSTPTPSAQMPLEDQTLIFQRPGSINLRLDESISNPATAPGSGLITYSSSDLDVATVDNTGTLKIVGAGTTKITASIAADSRYQASSTSYTLNISKLGQKLIIGEAPTNHIVGNNFSWAVSGEGTGIITYSSSDESVATVNASGEVELVGSGSVTLTVNLTGDAQYLPTTVSYQFDVARRPQTIIFKSAIAFTKNVGDASFINLATAPGTGTISYRSSADSVATVNNLGVVTVHGGGSATIYATVAADNQYLQAETSYQLTVNAIPRTLSFGTAGPLNVVVGDVVVNNVLGIGSGAISYYSSEPSIASVENGEVTAHSPGTVTITAKIEADNNYLESSASYEIKSGFRLRAWIGKNDTILDPPSDVLGFNLYRSSSANCDLLNYFNCADGQANLLNENSIIDTTTTLSRPGHYLFKNNNTEIAHMMRAEINNPASNVYTAFKARRGHQAVSFKNKIWVVGGETDNGNTFKNDIWSSTDGLIWVLEQSNAAFSPRSDHQLVEFDNKLWLVGGTQHAIKLNDVWSSSDGVNWILATNSAAFSGRQTAVATFNNKLWVIGGYDTEYRNDVWSSTDGINWINELNQAAFTARAKHVLAIFNNKLFLVGGSSTNGRLNDIWSSLDGVNWTSETSHAEFSARDAHISVFDNKLWLVGGAADNGRLSDVWSSVDGATWTEKTPSAEFTGRSSHQLITFENRLFVIAGDDANSATNKDFVGDVWSSTDGINWRIGYYGIVSP